MDVNRDRCGEDVAAYALGALPTADAKAFEAHLDTCALCQHDLAALKPVVDTLGETPAQIEPPARLKRELMAVVEADAEQRRRAAKAERPSWIPRVVLPGLAAAAVIVVVGVFLLGGETTYDAPGPDGARATLTVKDDDGEIHVEGMKALDSGRVMQVWLMRKGSDTPVPTDALFKPNASGAATVTVPGDMRDVTRVLISDEPDGGSAAPTTAPSVDFKLQS